MTTPTLQPPAPPTRTATRSHHPARRAVLTGLGVLGLGAVGGSAWALNRFVIDHVEVPNVSDLEAQQGSAAPTTDSATPEVATVTATGWTNGDSAVDISTHTLGSGSELVTYYVANVDLSDATLLRAAFAQDSFGLNITERTSEIAARVGAVFAINGDYYGFRDTGIVIRNGIGYRDIGARDGLALYRDGHIEIYDETTTTAQALIDAGVWNTMSFGPALVNGGVILDGIDDIEIDTNVGNRTIQGPQPRTAIGMVDANQLVLVVVDGRDEGYSVGVTMSGLAQIMIDLGAVTAYNLDGGGSATMFFNGELVNRPSNNGERTISDILYVAG